MGVCYICDSPGAIICSTCASDVCKEHSGIHLPVCKVGRVEKISRTDQLNS
jgi:hypothetical protein